VSEWLRDGVVQSVYWKTGELFKDTWGLKGDEMHGKDVSAGRCVLGITEEIYVAMVMLNKTETV
jgi:hypothetical protein